MSAMNVVLAAGGTAGHIEPALNLADALLTANPQTTITVIGSTRGLESALVPARGYRLQTLAAVPMPRRPTLDLLALPARLHATRKQAIMMLRECDADVVVGFGGYAALPTYLAARSSKVPLIIHEANAKAGLANRVGARWASEVLCTVPGTITGSIRMGLPLRPAIIELDRAERRNEARAFFGIPDHARVLLAFGGSQGAVNLNQALAQALPDLTDAGNWALHSFGGRNAPPAPRAQYVASAYIDRMDLAYAAADLAICRSGAMTCAELSAVGLPAIYVPLPIGNGEQAHNAQPIVTAGGGLMVRDEELSGTVIAQHAVPLLADPMQLAAMGHAAASIGDRQAGREFAAVVERVAHESRRK